MQDNFYPFNFEGIQKKYIKKNSKNSKNTVWTLKYVNLRRMSIKWFPKKKI